MTFAEGLVGITLDGKYRLDAVLGEGGMGSVFRATHLAMDRKVAIKLLKPHLTTDDTQLERFAREARSTMKVESPHVVKVLDFGITPQRDYYMVLEYLDGRTVQKELEVDGAFAPARAVHVIRQALHALGAAHDGGLVHRDLKPDNILLMRSGDDPDFAKLLDFGVAKLMEGSAKSSKSQLALTQTGMVFGTPEFMSPEQACGQPLDARSDLYSLACTLFVMVTGVGLFEALSPIEWLTCHVRTPAPRLATVNPALAHLRMLDDVLQRCLSKKREERPTNAKALDMLLAAVEPHLTAGAVAGRVHVGGAATAPIAMSPTGSTPISAGFGASVLLPALEPSMSMTRETKEITGDLDAIDGPPSKRGRVLLVAALGIVAVIVVAIVVAATRTPKTPPVLATGKNVQRDAAVVVPDAAPSVVIGDVDAAVAPVDAAVARPTARDAGPAPAVNPHLAAAEAAHASKNRLVQLAQADLALRDEPRSTRAKFLLGDALVQGGDLERGCKYLRALGKYPPAVAAATTCPAD